MPLSSEVKAVLANVKAARIAAGSYAEGLTLITGLTPIANLNPHEFVSLTELGAVFRPGALDGRLYTFQRSHDLLEPGRHDLRHTCATLMAEAGVDLVTISKALRHSKTGITADMYISATSAIQRKAAEAMGSIVSIGAGPAAESAGLQPAESGE